MGNLLFILYSSRTLPSHDLFCIYDFKGEVSCTTTSFIVDDDNR